MIIVKIQTSDCISAVHGMTVRFHYRTKPLPQNQQIRLPDLMFDLMSELQSYTPPFRGYKSQVFKSITQRHNNFHYGPWTGVCKSSKLEAPELPFDSCS